MFRWRELQKLAAAGAPEYGNYVMHWYDQYDIGLKGNWAAPDVDDSTWKVRQHSRRFLRIRRA